jgi:hypothetical protein
MKKNHLIMWILISFIMIFVCPPLILAENIPSVFVVITKGNQPSDTAESLLAGFLNNSCRVKTLADIDPGLLKPETLEMIKKGSFHKAKEAAIISGAHYFLLGKLDTQITAMTEFDMNIKMAVTTITYKLADSTHDILVFNDSHKYKGTDYTDLDAEYRSLQQMAEDLSRKISDKLSTPVSEEKEKKLAAMRQKLLTQQKGAETKVVSDKDKSINKDASADLRPKILIHSPPLNRGFTFSEKTDLTIQGTAVDQSGIAFVKINGNNAHLDSGGNFQYDTQLAPGNNHFIVLAKNQKGLSSSKEFDIDNSQDVNPPEIIILFPDPSRGFLMESTDSTEPVEIRGVVKDASEVIYLKINGKDVPVNAEGQFKSYLNGLSEENQVVIEASDSAGNIQKKIFQLARVSENKIQLRSAGLNLVEKRKNNAPALWGLTVGVSDYSSTSVNLKFADDDAISIARILKKQENKLYSEVNIKTLINKEVTRDAIINIMSRHLAKAAPDDTVFIFLAGHGTKHVQSGSYYFVPSDADSESLLSKGLRMSDFDESVKLLSQNVNKIIIVMDTCHSGALQLGSRASGGGEDLSSALNEASGRFILSASKPGEDSIENQKFKLNPEDSGHGAFTYSLIKGMQGEANHDFDNYITLNELFWYVAKQVPRITDGQQHPYFRMEGTDMPFVMIEK